MIFINSQLNYLIYLKESRYRMYLNKVLQFPKQISTSHNIVLNIIEIAGEYIEVNSEIPKKNLFSDFIET